LGGIAREDKILIYADGNERKRGMTRLAFGGMRIIYRLEIMCAIKKHSDILLFRIASKRSIRSYDDWKG
jgi:hypothetical protein